MTKLVTCSNARYLPRMAPYLESLRHSPFENYLAGVGCNLHDEFMGRFPHVRPLPLPAGALDGTPAETESVQHGSFLPYLPGNGDLIVFTDGDIVMQREPGPAEIDWLEKAAERGVGCGWNSGPAETLAVEGARLFPKRDPRETFGGLVDAPCYNIGVFAARRETYGRIHARYMALWPKACETFGGPARQQWLVCFVVAELGIPVSVMPYSTHTHGCYPLPAGAALNGQLTYEGRPVLFRHHV